MKPLKLKCGCEYVERAWTKMCDEHRAEFDKAHQAAMALYRAGQSRREQAALVKGLL